MRYTVLHSLILTCRHHMINIELDIENWINTGSGHGLLPDGTKPSPEPMWTNYHWGLVAFTWDQLHRQCWKYYSLIWVWLLLFQYQRPPLPGANKLRWSILFQMGISPWHLKDVLTIVILWWHFYLWSSAEHDGTGLYIKFDKVARNVYYRYWQISYNRTALQESPEV